MSSAHTVDSTTVRPKSQPRSDARVEKLPPYAVVLHNDDVNTMAFVVGVLCKVFGYGVLHATQLMLVAHYRGQVIVWTGSKEVAELKAEQVQSCGADPQCVNPERAQRLTVTVEPLP